MTNLRLHEFHLQMRLSSAATEALEGVAAPAPFDCEVALVAPVEGAGVVDLDEPELCSSGRADMMCVMCEVKVRGCVRGG